MDVAVVLNKPFFIVKGTVISEIAVRALPGFQAAGKSTFGIADNGIESTPLMEPSTTFKSPLPFRLCLMLQHHRRPLTG